MSRFDPRWYQIACLSTLLVYGMGWLDFDVTPTRVAVNLAAALATQYAGSRWKGIKFEPWSALISALSLCLLLRTNFHAVSALAAVLAVGSKFVIRVNGKHVYNPTNLGVVAAMVSGYGWVSPGQWGNTAWLSFAFACLGFLVVTRAERSDITWAALLFWSIGVFGRSWWVGEPMTIPLHRIQSGAFLLFSFFMISDPKTTPDQRWARVAYAAIVCFSAWYWQFRMFNNNGLVLALAFWSPLVPLLDRFAPGKRFAWPSLPSAAPTAQPVPAK